MFDGATSFEQSLCGEAWLNSKANTQSMFIDSGGSISCGLFQPQSIEDLKGAVNACLKQSSAGDCSTRLYGPIREWDVSQVTDMTAMFAVYSRGKHFNGDLSKWNVGKVTIMDNMFSAAKSFNKDLSKWDVAQVA